MVRIDSVAGMMNAPPTPMSARVSDEHVRRSVANADSTEPMPKTTSPKVRRLVAAEAVTEAARREQQAGEHERVGVDDPLQLAAGRAEAALRRPGARASAARR